jgi:hypothetical protein
VQENNRVSIKNNKMPISDRVWRFFAIAFVSVAIVNYIIQHNHTNDRLHTPAVIQAERSEVASSKEAPEEPNESTVIAESSGITSEISKASLRRFSWKNSPSRAVTISLFTDTWIPTCSSFIILYSFYSFHLIL